MKKLVVFDLDGTLTYTLEDIYDNLNLTLEHFGFKPVTKAETEKFVGDGVKKLVERAIKTPPPENFEEILSYYNDKYNYCGSPKTYVYKGVKKLVEKLKKSGYKLAILTNKPQEGADEVIKKFFAEGTFDLVFGQRKGIKVKPDKECALALLNEIGVPLKYAVFVGDGEADALTAKNAGADGISVLWGYRTEEELKKVGAKRFAATPEELFSAINSL
ncbi:MAG: HAD family hydrolase [Clostridia bacterium]|nr:HAD family hydrolase [Clostridia bacterium]